MFKASLSSLCREFWASPDYTVRSCLGEIIKRQKTKKRERDRQSERQTDRQRQRERVREGREEGREREKERRKEGGKKEKGGRDRLLGSPPVFY
jgi:hypothetical protein